jgi:DNA-binding transcriptional MerR regulator
LSTDTLRYYERKRVLPKPVRTAAGYRVYGAEALGRVQLIQRALAIGYGLDELAEILAVRDGGGAPCVQVRELAKRKLLEVEERLRNLEKLRAELRRILGDWDKRLQHSNGKQARLLESLPAPAARADRIAPRTKLPGGRKR